MSSEKWKPVLGILDRVCKPLDFEYRVSYESDDGKRIGLMFARAYNVMSDVLLAGWSSSPDILIDWFSFDGEVRISCVATLDTELTDALVDAFSRIRHVKTMYGDAVINRKSLLPEAPKELHLLPRAYPLVTASISKELSDDLRAESDRRKQERETQATIAA